MFIQIVNNEVKVPANNDTIPLVVESIQNIENNSEGNGEGEDDNDKNEIPIKNVEPLQELIENEYEELYDTV